MFLINLNMTHGFQTLKTLSSTSKWYKLEQPCFEDKLQELNTDFAKICISPKASGGPMGRVPTLEVPLWGQVHSKQ